MRHTNMLVRLSAELEALPREEATLVAMPIAAARRQLGIVRVQVTGRESQALIYAARLAGAMGSLPVNSLGQLCNPR